MTLATMTIVTWSLSTVAGCCNDNAAAAAKANITVLILRGTECVLYVVWEWLIVKLVTLGAT